MSAVAAATAGIPQQGAFTPDPALIQQVLGLLHQARTAQTTQQRPLDNGPNSLRKDGLMPQNYRLDSR